MTIIRLKTAATLEPVTVAELKVHCNIASNFTADDTLLTTLIKAVRQQGENLTGAAWVESTWEQIMEGFPVATRTNPRAGIELLKHPISSTSAVSSVTYLDSNGDSQTLTVTTNYKLVLQGGPTMGIIYPAYGYTWPDTYDDPEAVTITFKAGWTLTGGTTITTPAILQTWLKEQAAALYENREGLVTIFVNQQINEIPRPFLNGLLDLYTVERRI